MALSCLSIGCLIQAYSTQRHVLLGGMVRLPSHEEPGLLELGQ